MNVPYFRPAIGEAEIGEVVKCLRSGWLTTGPMTRRFEESFADAVGARHAIAVNSCTARLHLAVEALGLARGEGVLVPTMTFAATAEVIRYVGAVPILVDCDPRTLNMDLADARRKLDQAEQGGMRSVGGEPLRVVGLIPVHVGGQMMDMRDVRALAEERGLFLIEDSAHASPAAWRESSSAAWRRSGEGTAEVSCFSFYANKTITTGEGGMAVTNDQGLADRMRMMSLHGLSHDAWKRYSGGNWDYRIVEAGFKYNLTDIAAAIGVHQLAGADAMRVARQQIAERYLAAMADIEQIELPHPIENRIHAWHLFPIRLRLPRLSIDRDTFMEKLKAAGVGCSVHWRPLHLHPYYTERFGWRAEDFPVATAEWQRLVSLPLFPDMQPAEFDQVVATVRSLCHEHRA